MRKFLWLKIFFAACLLLSAACGSKARIDPLSVAPGASDSDPEFTAAVQQAHDTLDIFRQALLSPNSSQSWIGLRVRIEAIRKGTDEFHWTKVVDYFEGIFTVELLDSVNLDLGLHTGRLIEVPLEDVIDWMIVNQDGTFTGGYTVLLAYQRMTPAERRKFIEVTGYVIR